MGHCRYCNEEVRGDGCTPDFEAEDCDVAPQALWDRIGKLEAALRPFAEAYRAGSFGDGAHPHDMVHLYVREETLSRAAELLPEQSSGARFE